MTVPCKLRLWLYKFYICCYCDAVCNMMSYCTVIQSTHDTTRNVLIMGTLYNSAAWHHIVYIITATANVELIEVTIRAYIPHLDIIMFRPSAASVMTCHQWSTLSMVPGHLLQHSWPIITAVCGMIPGHLQPQWWPAIIDVIGAKSSAASVMICHHRCLWCQVICSLSDDLPS